MRVFVYEYVCSGGMMGQPVPPSLAVEGWAMLSAVLEDFQRVPGVETVTLLAGSYDPRGGGTVVRREQGQDEAALFRRLARAADYTLVIAPEFDDLLATRCQWVEEAGGRLLGPAPAAVRLTGDKLALDRHLGQYGVATPASQPWTPGEPVPAVSFPAVCKPRHGAGSQATFLVSDPAALTACAEKARAEGWSGDALVQSYVAGCAASVALLTGPRELVPLPPAAQRLSEDGRFYYQGGQVPLPPALAVRAHRLACRAVQTVSGLCGYVGVDLVLGKEADGSQDWVIEINPRLTTSYVGLRALAEDNLAEVMLCCATGEELPTLRWRPEVVHFDADGSVRRTDSRSGLGASG
jgi:predicted ATP-grasp superfamily ATP-dependent carboligase